MKVNHADEIEDELKITIEELETIKVSLSKALAAKSRLEQKLLYTEQISKEHIDHLEHALMEVAASPDNPYPAPQFTTPLIKNK